MGCGERMQEDVGDQRRANTHCWQCIEPRGPVRGTAIGGCRASPSPPNPRASCEGRTAAEPKQVAIAASQSAANWAVRAGGTFCFLPSHLFAVHAVPVLVARIQGQTTQACQGMRLARGGGADASARRSLRSGGSPSTLAAPESGRERRLVAKARTAAKASRADHRST